MLSIDYASFRAEFVRKRATYRSDPLPDSPRRISKRTNQKPFSMISTKERSTSFEGSRIMLSQKVRQTERKGLELAETPWLTLTPLQKLILNMERERSITKRDASGKTIERSIGGLTIWSWIAGQLRRAGYPDMDVSGVLRELDQISRIKATIENLRLN